jgi:type VI secretion system secreted protein VgrG
LYILSISIDELKIYAIQICFLIHNSTFFSLFAIKIAPFGGTQNMAATAPKANQAHFHFICGDLDKSTFEVLEFTGVERISMPYEFKISLISRDDSIDLETVIYKPGTLYIGEETDLYPYSGVVIEFRLLDKNTDFSTYQAILVSKLWLTNMNNQSRIMVQKTLSDSIKEVLTAANVKKINFDEGTIRNNTNFEYLVQYQESDFAFINRLMEDAGIWYFFEEPPLQATDKSEEMLVITGSSSAFQNISGQTGIPYKEVSGLDGDISINHLQYERRVISKGVFVKNYNYRDPSTDLADKGQAEKGSAGTVYEYGGPNKDATAVHDAVEILANRINSNAIELSGTSNCARFKTGYRFTVKEHFRADIKDQEFVLTSVTHSGNHLSGIATYRNKFSCIPSALASNYAPEKKTVVPRVPGLLTAKIEADGTDYATLDDKGRYKVKMHFDLAQTSNLGGSKYVRLAQPYSGAQY